MSNIFRAVYYLNMEDRIVYLFYISLLGILYFLYITQLWLLIISITVSYFAYEWIKEANAGWEGTRGKAVLITGCDTGFGHELAVRLDGLGCVVFAGCLNADSHGARKLRKNTSKHLHVVPMNVGSDESVTKALVYIKSHCPRAGLWGIVNNAGFNVMGDVELLGVPMYHKAMNVNFYGAVRVMRSFLFLVRRHKGRVVVVSSGRGTFPGPRDSAYHVTKHCLETFSDSLRLEMKKFGVKVAVVYPGHYAAATACQDSIQFARYKQELDDMWAAATDEIRSTYGEYYQQSLLDGQAEDIKRSALDTTPVIDALVHALFRDRPKLRYNVSGSNCWYDRSAMMIRIYPYLPTSVTDYIITKRTNCDKFPQKP